MNKLGHIGLALIFAAPIALVLGLTLGPTWSMIFFGMSLFTFNVPDIDQRTSLIKHRGFTHTIWFGIIISGILTALLVPVFGIRTGSTVQLSDIVPLLTENWIPIAVIYTGLLTGIVSHIFGDTLTEAYDYTINPFWPISNKAYTLDWTNADSTVWNIGLLVGGVISAITALFIAVL